MKNMLSRFWYEEEGLGTVEMVILLSVLVAIALMFKDTITKFVEETLADIFKF